MNKISFVEVYSDKVIITGYIKDTQLITKSFVKNLYDETNNISFSFDQVKVALKEYHKKYKSDGYYLILSETFNVDYCNILNNNSHNLIETIQNELSIKIQNTSYENKEIFYKNLKLGEMENNSFNHILFVKKEIVTEFVNMFSECKLNLIDVLFDNVCLHVLFKKYQSNCILSDRENTFMVFLDIKENGTIITGLYKNYSLVFPVKYGLNYYISIGQLQFDTDMLEFFEIFLKNQSPDFNFIKIILSGNCEKNGEIIHFLNETKFPLPMLIYPVNDFSKLFNLKIEEPMYNINVILGAIEYINKPLYENVILENYNTDMITKIKLFFKKLLNKEKLI